MKMKVMRNCLELDWDEPITIEMLKDDDSELMKDYQLEIMDWIENNGDSIRVEWDAYGLRADFVIED